MKLRKNKLQPIRFDFRGAFVPSIDGSSPMGVAEVSDVARPVSTSDRTAWSDLLLRLAGIRDSMRTPEVGGEAIPASFSASMRTLGAGFIRSPERALETYLAQRQTSELGKIFRAANRFHALVDRVVVIGSYAESSGARAILDSCCQPYWNELSRGDRGSKPRMYFAGDQLDNDALQSLLYLLGAHRGQVAHEMIDRWGICVIDQTGATVEAEIALQHFIRALRASLGENQALLPECILAVTGHGSCLESRARDMGLTDVLSIPDDVGVPFSVLSPAGLLPAALVGVNVIELLEGAAWMTRHFAETPPEQNMVLQWVAVHDWLRSRHGIHVRVLDVGNQALEACGHWCSQLMSMCLGQQGLGCIPIAAVHTRNSPARLQSQRLGGPHQVVHHWGVDEVRFDALPIEDSAYDRAGKTIAEAQVNHRADPDSDDFESDHFDSDPFPRNDLVSGAIESTPSRARTLPQASAFAMQSTYGALLQAGRPTTQLHLPRADELHMGQLFQMMMLATWVEALLSADGC